MLKCKIYFYMSMIVGICTFISLQAETNVTSLEDTSEPVLGYLEDELSLKELVSYMEALFLEKRVYHECKSRVQSDILESVLNSENLEAAFLSAKTEDEDKEFKGRINLLELGAWTLAAYGLFVTLFNLAAQRSGCKSTALGAISAPFLATAVIDTISLFNQMSRHFSRGEPFSSLAEFIECLKTLLKEAQEQEEHEIA